MAKARVSDFFSLVKFSHTLFALPFALVGFFLAYQMTGAVFPVGKLLLVILCMVFARSAAMGFNRYIDRKIDQRNPRTANREIPAGVISPSAALAFVIIASVLFTVCTWFINPLCFYLSPVALLVILGYSWTKRFTSLCHLVLGVGLSLAPIGAYLAVLGQFDLLPLLLSFAVFLWVSGFDIIYALQDEEFDRSQKLHSIPAALGKKRALMLSNILHLFCGFFILYFGYYGQFGLFFWIGALVFLFLLTYQHFLVKPNDLSKVNLAFFTTNGIASVVLGVMAVLDVLLG